MTEATISANPPSRLGKSPLKINFLPLNWLKFKWVKSALLTAIKEPFFHFILLGALLFALSEYLEARANHARIEVTKAQIEGIANNYQLQYGNPPSDVQLQSLVDSFVREEVFYHEALRLHLDQDDEIIRRRLVQKYEFLQQDLGIAKTPTESDLKAFYAQHQSQYAIAPKISFSHVFFSTDSRGEQGAQLAAQAALLELNKQGLSRAPEAGDNFSGASDYAALDAVAVARLFGKQGLAEQVFDQPAHQWVGPFRSGYGWHVVYVADKQAAANPPFAEIKEAVLTDYIESERGLRNQESLEKLKKSFTISVGKS